jgi:hypothetical protein
MRREDDGKTAATIANPVTEEFQIVRVNLLSGLLKTISENRSVFLLRLRLPLRLYLFLSPWVHAAFNEGLHMPRTQVFNVSGFCRLGFRFLSRFTFHPSSSVCAFSLQAFST